MRWLTFGLLLSFFITYPSIHSGEKEQTQIRSFDAGHLAKLMKEELILFDELFFQYEQEKEQVHSLQSEYPLKRIRIRLRPRVGYRVPAGFLTVTLFPDFTVFIDR